MTAMLERCARAVEGAQQYYAPHNRPDLIARAVIEALMEPTPEMVEAGAKGSGEDSPAVAEGAWDAMLRAALGDEDAG